MMNRNGIESGMSVVSQASDSNHSKTKKFHMQMKSNTRSYFLRAIKTEIQGRRKGKSDQNLKIKISRSGEFGNEN